MNPQKHLTHQDPLNFQADASPSAQTGTRPGGQMERKILESVDLLRSAFENKINELTEANRRLKRRIFDLYTIFEISRKLNSTLDPNSLLEEMLLTLIGQLEIKGAAIFIQKDTNQKELSMFKIRGIDLKRHPDFTEFKFRQDGALLKLLLSENGPLFLDEIRAHIKKGSPGLVLTSSRENSIRTKEISVLEALECELCVPLISKNQIRGILSLAEKTSNLPFTDSDLEFLSVLTSQFTSTVENAILYESQKNMNLELRRTQKCLQFRFHGCSFTLAV